MIRSTIMASAIAFLALQTSLLGSTTIVPNLNQELAQNKVLIKEYKATVEKLEKRNAFLEKEKAAHPKLYERKALFEETKEAYIHRIKLNGAEAKNINFTIKDHMVTLEMNIKIERNDNNGFYSSSQYFYQAYKVPDNVDETKIKHSVDGDYFVITMPKK